MSNSICINKYINKYINKLLYSYLGDEFNVYFHVYSFTDLKHFCHDQGAT